MNNRFGRRVNQVLGIALVLGVSGGLVGCSSGSKTPAQQATADLNKGLAAHVAGNLDEAMKNYQAVLAKDSSNKFAFYNIALIEQSRNQLTDADRDYRKGLAVDADYVPALFNLATVRTALNDNKGAIDLYQKVISIQADDAEAHLNLGFALKKAGQEQQGQAEIVKAQQLGLGTSAKPQGTTATTVKK